MRRRDCGGGPRSRAPPGHSPGSHRRDAGDLPETPPVVGAQSGLSPGGRRDVQSRRPRAWPVGHTPAAAQPPRPASAHLHREPLAPRALGPRLRRSDRARGCARSSARGAAGGVGRVAAAWAAAAAEEEDSGAPLKGDPPSSRPLCSSRRRSLPGRGRVGRGASRHFLSARLNTPWRPRTKALRPRRRPSSTASWRTYSEPPASRGTIASQGRDGVPVSRCLRLPRTLRGSWRKKGRGRPPSCLCGLLGSLASVFQRVACIVACRRSSPGKWISDLSWLQGLGS